MGFYLYDQLLGLLIFFSVLCTITVGLRVLVRTKLTKGAFGWDDVALVFSYVSLFGVAPIIRNRQSALGSKV